VRSMIRAKRYREMVRGLSDAVIEPPLRSAASEPASVVLHPGLDRTLSSLFRASTTTDRRRRPWSFTR